MKRDFFVDTSAWYAFLNASDPACAAVREAVAAARRIVTTNYVVDETITLALMRSGHRAAVRIGEILRDPAEVETFWVDPEVEQEAWALFAARPDKVYSFTDCTSFVSMRRLGLGTALATDPDFKREGFEVVP